MMRRPPVPPGPMHAIPPSQVSNVTNSNDPASKNSRVFVGNLNTFALSKEDVDAIFHRYGMVTGISMHKGYAFVQFSHPSEARRAVGFEDGQMYAGQALDLNVVSEPKNRPPAQKRPAVQNDKRPMMRPMATPSVPPAKRPRQESAGNPSLQRTLVTLSSNRMGPTPPMRRPVQSAATRTAAAVVRRATATVTKAAVNSTAAKSASGGILPSTDILICGVCKTQFTSLHSLAQHKKVPCRLRASCQCQTNPPQNKDDDQPMQLDCASCDARFDSAWALCQHCQTEHKLSIFRTEENSAETTTNSNNENSKESDQSASGQNMEEKAETSTTSKAKTTPAKK